MADFSAQNRRGFNAPTRFEATVYDCETVGQVPTDIAGAFVRVGGEYLYPSKYKDDGPSSDGYISSFRFKNGRVNYVGKWVKTTHFKNNLAAHRQLYGYYRNPWDDDPSVTDVANPQKRGVANTAPIAHGGKLFALKEDGPPFEVHPDTLETIGPWDFHGKYKSQTFTAHPKIDPVSGEMICYGYEATGPASKDLWVYSVDKKGHVSHEWRATVPYVSMMHDMALTQKHIIFPSGGYVTSIEQMKAHKNHWFWDPHKGSYIGVLPRDGDGKDMRWFFGPKRCFMHTFNARTEGNKVILEAPFFDDNFLFSMLPTTDGSAYGKMDRAKIRRYVLDLDSKSDQWSEEILWPMQVSDLGRIDTRYITLPNRYGFTGYIDPEKPFDEKRGGNMRGRATNIYARFDFRDRKLDNYFVGDVHSLGECCFVPRRGSTEEGDGYLIGVASNFAEMRSELIIADARNLAAGDIARVLLPFRAGALHGVWVEEKELPFGAVNQTMKG
jgi:carotenoid cleavage dioxygenase